MPRVTFMNSSKSNEIEQLSQAKELAESVRASLINEVYAGSLTLNSKLPFKAISLRELLHHRLSDLVDVSIQLCEANLLVSAFVMARAVVETTAMLFWLHKKTVEFNKTKDVGVFDQFLMKGMFGSKDAEGPVLPHNILSAVDHLEKKSNGFRHMYDILCEFTHPNYAGVLGTYGWIDESKHMVYLGKHHQELPAFFAVGPLTICMELFKEYYNKLSEEFKVCNDYFEQHPTTED